MATTLPVSSERSRKLREHLRAVGKTYHGSLTETVDSLIDGYLRSPAKDLRERVARRDKELADLRSRVSRLERRQQHPIPILNLAV